MMAYPVVKEYGTVLFPSKVIVEIIQLKCILNMHPVYTL
jgi:hypothetical protein